MNDVRFDPPSWINAAERIQQASDSFARAGHSITVAKNIWAVSTSVVDHTASNGDKTVNKQWYELIGRAVEALNSDASKMTSTGKNYKAMEEEGTRAAKRFWS